MDFLEKIMRKAGSYLTGNAHKNKVSRSPAYGKAPVEQYVSPSFLRDDKEWGAPSLDRPKKAKSPPKRSNSPRRAQTITSDTGDWIRLTKRNTLYSRECRRLTRKNIAYFKHIGLGDYFWIYVPSRLFAAEWIYRNLTPAEFETFCAALLSEHCGAKDARVTEKRASGADGGIDVFGRLTLDDGQDIPFALEAKCHNPNAQVGSDICQKLIGAMAGENIRHGFILTTGNISKNARNYIDRIHKSGTYKIELIDQDQLTDIMLRRLNRTHGYGLYCSDELKCYYLSEDILLKAAGRI